MRVSVIIPTYNRAEYLFKAISSVLNQTISDIELLVCDDGSTDNSYEIVELFKDPRIRWLPGPNSGGPAEPRNRGITESKGEWLAFLDSDDSWESDKLEKQLEVLSNHSIQAVCTNAMVLLNDGLNGKTYFKFNNDVIYTFKDMLQVNTVICSSMMIHNSIVKSVGGFPEDHDFKGIEDYVMWVATSMITDIYYINDPLITYRDEPNDSMRGEIKTTKYLRHKYVLRETLRRMSLLKINKHVSHFIILKHRLMFHLSYIKQVIKVLLK